MDEINVKFSTTIRLLDFDVGRLEFNKRISLAVEYIRFGLLLICGTHAVMKIVNNSVRIHFLSSLPPGQNSVVVISVKNQKQ